MIYPIIVFQDNATTYRILVPDFNSLSVTAETLEQALSTVKDTLSKNLATRLNSGKPYPKASQRDAYITQYIEAVLISTIDIDLPL